MRLAALQFAPPAAPVLANRVPTCVHRSGRAVGQVPEGIADAIGGHWIHRYFRSTGLTDRKAARHIGAPIPARDGLLILNEDRLGSRTLA